MKSFKVYTKNSIKIICSITGVLCIGASIFMIVSSNTFTTFLFFIPFLLDVFGLFVISQGFIQFSVENKNITYQGSFFFKKSFKVKEIKKIELKEKSEPSLEADSHLYIDVYGANNDKIVSFNTDSMINTEELLRVMRSGGAKVIQNKKKS